MSVIYRALRKLDKENRQTSPGGEVMPPTRRGQPSPLALRLVVGGVSLLAGAGAAWYFLAHRAPEPPVAMPTPVAVAPHPAAAPVAVAAAPALAPNAAPAPITPPAPMPVALAPPPPSTGERVLNAPAPPTESLPVTTAVHESPAPASVAEQLPAAVSAAPAVDESPAPASVAEQLPADEAVSAAPPPAAPAENQRLVMDTQVRALVKEVRAAVQKRDQKAVTQGLDRLSRTLGKESVTVQKLRAFWLMQVSEYPAAEQLWKKVLARNPGDLDAGINMALVELVTGRLAQGKERLAVLLRDYPEDTRVQELYRKVKDR